MAYFLNSKKKDDDDDYDEEKFEQEFFCVCIACNFSGEVLLKERNK